MQTPIHTPDESATALGAFFCLVWLVVILWWIAVKSRVVTDTVAWFRRKAVPTRIFALLVLLAIVAIGGSKSGGSLGMRPPAASALEVTRPEAAFPPFALVEARTNGVVLAEASTNAVVSESCLRHGTSEGGEWIEAETPFFRWGTNDIRRLYASPACLSFGTMRHPFHGDALPNGTDAESLVALRMPLGIVPAANWHLLEGTGVVSRFWHDALPGGGRVFTWENALLDRLASRPATIQAELHRNGDFIYRYDFSESGPPGGRPLPAEYPAATPGVVPSAGHNPVLIGAQRGVVGEEVFRAVGVTTNCAIVYRLDGDTAENGVSVATLLAAPLLELRWKNVAGLGDFSDDTDGDGLTDWQEVFLHGTDPRYADTDGDGKDDGIEIEWGDDPFDADENGDGIPDGASAAEWSANTLWATNSMEGGNMAITLNEAIPEGGSATLLLGDLAIPLRGTNSMEFCLPFGETIEGRLFSRGVDVVNLFISPKDNPESTVLLRGGGVPGVPRLRDDPRGVLDGNSNEGTFRIAIPEVVICNPDGTRAQSECIHASDGSREYIVRFEPDDWGLSLDNCAVDGFERIGSNRLRLSVGDDSSDYIMGRVLLTKYVDYGIVEDSVLLWRCSMSAEEEYPAGLQVSSSILPRHSTNPVGRPTIGCRLTVTNGSDHAATVNISGPKLRFGPNATESLTVTLPYSGAHYDFVVSGEEASEAMNDAVITVRRDGPSGPVCATAALTVVWVDPITMRCGQDEPFSMDNNCAIKPTPALLGSRNYDLEGGIGGFGYIVEFRGNVHPESFPFEIAFARDRIDEWQAGESNRTLTVTLNQRQVARVEPPGNDDPPPECQSRLPSPSNFVYDFDAPGFQEWSLLAQPGGLIYYQRFNFIQYATLNGIRCSDDFFWWARITVHTGGEGYNYQTDVWSRPGHDSDNQVGIGTTSMGKD